MNARPEVAIVAWPARTSMEEKMPKPRKKTVPNSGRAHLTLRAKSNPRNGRQHAQEGAQVLDLSRYAIGTRLRHARLMRGSRLKDVADAAGCSESLVSKIENNKIEPSLQVLHKLCTVLKIGLGELFTRQEEDAPVVTRAGQRSRIEMDPVRRGNGILMERVIPYAKGHLLQSNIHVDRAGRVEFWPDLARGRRGRLRHCRRDRAFPRRQGLSAFGRRHVLFPVGSRSWLPEPRKERGAHSVREHAADLLEFPVDQVT